MWVWVLEEDGNVVCVEEYVYVWMCWEWHVAHEEVEKGRLEYRPFGHSVGEASLNGWCAVVDCLRVSTCKEGRQHSLW